MRRLIDMMQSAIVRLRFERGGGAADDPTVEPPPAAPGHGAPPAPPDSDSGDAPRPRRPRGPRWLMRGAFAAAVLCAVSVGLLAAGLSTERGTQYVWRAARALTGGRLSGTLEGGTLADGVRFQNLAWTGSGGGMALHIDRISGRWALTRAPWRLTIDTLRAGIVDLTLPPSEAAAEPVHLPADLRLPLALTIGQLSVEQLRLHDAGSTTVLGPLRLHGTSDGRHHVLSVDRFDTPYGALRAQARMDGVRPFPLEGSLAYTGTLAAEPVSAQAQLSGSLAALTAEIEASGAKLDGRGHLEAAPFSAVPLTRAELRFDHVNPAAFEPNAPPADLAVRADLAPVPDAPHGLTVAGPVSIVNARPGLYTAGALPLVDASANLRLDARTQRIDGLKVRLVQGASLSGGGQITDGAGRFDIAFAGLDPHTFATALRPLSLSGPLAVTFAPGRQTVTLKLADAARAHTLDAQIASTAQQTTIESARLGTGAGRLELKGVLQHDARATFTLDSRLNAFDPLAWAASGGSTRGAAPGAGSARVTGTLSGSGTLTGGLTAQARFSLGESVYDGLPMTGAGQVRLVGARLLPSHLDLSVAGNQVALNGSFGAPGDRLTFAVDAPQLDRLGFGLAGALDARGALSGTLARPSVDADYRAQGLVFGANRVGSAHGHAQIRDGLDGRFDVSLDASGVALADTVFDTVSAQLSGTRAHHALDARARGMYQGQPLDLALAASGALVGGAGGMRWDGALTRFENQGLLAFALDAPLSISVGPQRVVLGATRLSFAGATLDLRRFDFSDGTLRSAGALSNLQVARLLALKQALTGTSTPVRTDLVLNGQWDFTLGAQASGFAELARSSGDAILETGRGSAALGVSALAARARFTSGNRLELTAQARASRVGSFAAALSVPFALQDGRFAPAENGALRGTVDADLPALKTTGGLFGPSYLLDGRASLKLSVAGTPSKPMLSGTLNGDDLSATLVDLGAQLKDGIVRVALSDNLVTFQQVEFHGAQGTLRVLGRVRLDGDAPDLAASVVADKLELFAAPDRQLSLSGQATVENDGAQGGVAIRGKFAVDHALFDLPEQAAPHLSDDVVIVGPDSTVRGAAPSGTSSGPGGPAGGKVGSALMPRADVDIDLGRNFRFKGQGADLGLLGTITVTSAPGAPLRAVGNVRTSEGSTYTAFGRKLAIENGFFTFNGPVTNPGINILAMRRNQEVEAGVQVTGTADAPSVKLVSEPNVADNEKLSWLLFGHGTDEGSSIGQQSTMTAALALLGNATGKRVAQTFGLDEISIGRSEVGLTDPQVVLVSKAINERLVLGYEQGLQSANNAFKATLNLTRFWSVSAYTGTFDGVDLSYTRRFDHWW